MPRQTGFDVLDRLRYQIFSKLKVVVLSGSIEPAEIKKAVDLEERSFTGMRPIDLPGLVGFEKSLEGYMTRTPNNESKPLFHQ